MREDQSTKVRSQHWGDRWHPRELVGHTTNVGLLKGNQEKVRTEFDALAHETHVHAKEVIGDGIMDKLVINVDGITDDRMAVG